jgi:RNA polymerase sigma-70 factor, ECF subfamily
MDEGVGNNYTDDQTLIECLHERGRDAVEEIVERFSRPIFSFIVRMIGNRDVAEDIFQETWLRVIRSAGSFRGDSKVSTWLFQIALNLCRDHIRKVRKYKEIPLDDMEQLLTIEPAIDPIQMLTAQEVRHMIMELPTKMREVIVLHFYHDLDNQEIAMVVGCPQGTVKTRYHRAIKILLRKWNIRNKS